MPSPKSPSGSSSLVPLILLAVFMCVGFITVFMMVQVRSEDSTKALSVVSQKLDALDAQLKAPKATATPSAPVASSPSQQTDPTQYKEPNFDDATNWVKQNPTLVDPPAANSFTTKNWNGIPLVYPVGSRIIESPFSILISSHDLTKVWLCGGGAIAAPCLAGYSIRVSPYVPFEAGYQSIPSKEYPGLSEIVGTEGADYEYHYSFSVAGKKYLINLGRAEISTAGTYKEPNRYDVDGVVKKFLTAISNAATK